MLMFIYFTLKSIALFIPFPPYTYLPCTTFFSYTPTCYILVLYCILICLYKDQTKFLTFFKFQISKSWTGIMKRWVSGLHSWPSSEVIRRAGRREAWGFLGAGCQSTGDTRDGRGRLPSVTVPRLGRSGRDEWQEAPCGPSAVRPRCSDPGSDPHACQTHTTALMSDILVDKAIIWC